MYFTDLVYMRDNEDLIFVQRSLYKYTRCHLLSEIEDLSRKVPTYLQIAPIYYALFSYNEVKAFQQVASSANRSPFNWNLALVELFHDLLAAVYRYKVLYIDRNEFESIPNGLTIESLKDLTYNTFLGYNSHMYNHIGGDKYHHYEIIVQHIEEVFERRHPDDFRSNLHLLKHIKLWPSFLALEIIRNNQDCFINCCRNIVRGWLVERDYNEQKLTKDERNKFLKKQYMEIWGIVQEYYTNVPWYTEEELKNVYPGFQNSYWAN